MVKKLLVRGFVVMAVLATGGVAVAAVQARDTGTSAPAVASAATAHTTLVTSEASARGAIMSACGGRSLVATLDDAQSANVDQMVNERSLQAAGLAGLPIDGSGVQAGVDEVLHLQALDRSLAAVLCPTP